MIEKEWNLIDRLKKTINFQGLSLPPHLAKDLGNDIAVIDIGNDKLGLMATTINVERIHFRPDLISPENIGYKCMIRNISDIIVTGGKPKFSFISLGIPPYYNEEYIHEIHKGMLIAAREAEITIVGGDVSKASELFINIAIYGEVRKEKLITKTNAAVNDSIFVTGHVGNSLAGLSILLKEKSEYELYENNLINHYCKPIMRVDIQLDIIYTFNPSTITELSDSLPCELRKLCLHSEKGFILNKTDIPISDDLKLFSAKTNLDPYEIALKSCMEYELIFTAKKNPLHPNEQFINGVKINKIGEITDNGFFMISENKKSELNFEKFIQYSCDI